ncbi:MAG: hypothetical protein AB4038_04755 [Prochloraceae cyanobacterium]
MLKSTATPAPDWQEDSQVWQSLKQAIAYSSGFKRWQQEQNIQDKESSANIDPLVRRYLRETLETLAY